MDGAVSEAERRAYLRKTYFIAAMYIIATSAMTFLTVTLGVLHDFVLNNVYLALIGMALVFVCIIVLFIVPLKFPYKHNIIVAILLVASLTIAVVTVSAPCTPIMVLAAYATAITAAVLVSLFTVFIACDITQEMNILAIILLHFEFGLNLIFMIVTIYRKFMFRLHSVIFHVFVMFILLIYHSEVICGNKFAIIEKYGTNGASVIIYLDVTIGYIVILELYKRTLKEQLS